MRRLLHGKTVPKMKQSTVILFFKVVQHLVKRGGFPSLSLHHQHLSFHFFAIIFLRSWRICVVWAAPWNAWCWWIIRQFRWHCALTTVSSSQAGPVQTERLSSAQDSRSKGTQVNAGNSCNIMQCKKNVDKFCQGSLWTY